MQQRVSRDADIVVAAMISIVGSTLIFQGWRLDPLLLLCQVRMTMQPRHMVHTCCTLITAGLCCLKPGWQS